MKRFVIMTVGKTHSGKTTFARVLEKQLRDSVVIDQDNHAEFINKFYGNLQPKRGPNTLKHAISQTIVDHAIQETNFHLIICNSNRARKSRVDLLNYFHDKGFTTILVHFDIPDPILQARIAETERSTAVFRGAATFEEVLIRQQADSRKSDVKAPVEGEADYLFVVKSADEVQAVPKEIAALAQS